MRRLRYNSAAALAGAVVSQLQLAVLLWLFARFLPVEQFGQLLAVYGIAVLTVSLMDVGLNTWTIRAMALSSSHKKAIFEESLGLKILLSTCVGVIWLLGGLIFGRSLVMLTFALFVIAEPLTNAFEVPFRASEQFVRVAILQVGRRGVALALGWAFLKARPDALIFPVVMAVGSVVMLAAAWSWYRVKIRVGIRWSGIARLMKQSWVFGLSGFAAQVQRADVAIVAAVASSFAAGIYAAPARLTGPLNLVPTALAGVLLPRMSRAGTPQLVPMLKGVVLVVVVQGVALTAVAVTAPYTVISLLGPSYEDSIAVLRVLCLALVLVAFNAPVSAMLQGLRLERYVAYVVSAGAVVSLGLVAGGAWLGGALGATWGMAGMQLVIFVCLCYGIRMAMRRGSLEECIVH